MSSSEQRKISFPSYVPSNVVNFPPTVIAPRDSQSYLNAISLVSVERMAPTLFQSLKYTPSKQYLLKHSTNLVILKYIWAKAPNITGWWFSNLEKIMDNWRNMISENLEVALDRLEAKPLGLPSPCQTTLLGCQGAFQVLPISGAISALPPPTVPTSSWEPPMRPVPTRNYCPYWVAHSVWDSTRIRLSHLSFLCISVKTPAQSSSPRLSQICIPKGSLYSLLCLMLLLVSNLSSVPFETQGLSSVNSPVSSESICFSFLPWWKSGWLSRRLFLFCRLL